MKPGAGAGDIRGWAGERGTPHPTCSPPTSSPPSWPGPSCWGPGGVAWPAPGTEGGGGETKVELEEDIIMELSD